MYLIFLADPAAIATAKVARSALPDAPVIPWQPKSPSAPRRFSRHVASVLRRPAGRVEQQSAV
jgi:hypothetical protein